VGAAPRGLPPPHPSPPLPGRLIFTHPSVDPHVALQPTPGPVDFVRALHTVSQDDWTTVVFPFFRPPPPPADRPCPECRSILFAM